MSLFSNRVITDFTTSQNVSTLTVLQPFTSYQQQLRTLLMTVVNLSGVETLLVTFETSQDGTATDTELKWTRTANPLEQASLEIGPGVLRAYWRISANTISLSAAPVKWQVCGVPVGIKD